MPRVHPNDLGNAIRHLWLARSVKLNLVPYLHMPVNVPRVMTWKSPCAPQTKQRSTPHMQGNQCMVSKMYAIEGGSRMSRQASLYSLWQFKQFLMEFVWNVELTESTITCPSTASGMTLFCKLVVNPLPLATMTTAGVSPYFAGSTLGLVALDAANP